MVKPILEKGICTGQPPIQADILIYYLSKNQLPDIPTPMSTYITVQNSVESQKQQTGTRQQAENMAAFPKRTTSHEDHHNIISTIKTSL